MSISSMVAPEPEVPTTETATEPEVAPVGTSDVPTGSNPTVPEPKDKVLDALLDKIQPVTAVKRNLKIMIYSDPGAGKSTFLGSAPDNLIIDVEDGLASINNHPELMGKNVKSIAYKTFAGLELIIKKLHEAPPELADIKTLSIDSASELHKRGLAEVTEREYNRNPISNNRYVAEVEQHTENNEHIRRLVSSLRDLDRNLIMTAHARTIEPKNKPSKTFPDFSEKLANTLAGIMDIVGYMYLKEIDGQVRRILRFHSNGDIVAKTRIGGFPEEMIDPTWDKIMKIVNSGN